MSRVGQKNTKPELAVRKLLHDAGWRYRLHRKGLPGTPDIVFGRLKAAIFVHGCYWHGHSCKLGRPSKSHVEFWSKKIADNRARDSRKVDGLVAASWRAMTVWQCSLADPAKLLEDMEKFLRGDLHVVETEPKTGV